MVNDEDPVSNQSAEAETEIALDVLPLHSTNLLTVLDANGIVQYKSPSIERILGFDQDELVGKQIAECVHPDDLESVLQAFQNVLSSDEYTVEAIEYRHEKADGAYVWVESVASSDPTPDGHYVVNTREISERKERERHLERKNERLEEFASFVSHDLRNPLTVAQGHLMLAEADCQSEHHEAISVALDRMEDLIEDLLTITRSGDSLDEREPVDLATLAAACWQTVETAEATLVTDVDRPIQADRSRVRQLLENLLRNAIEHGGDDVTITVGECSSRPGFYVEDDGPGVAAADRKRLFESGFTTEERGTGLGLAIVREIVEAHGWEITLTEGSGGGARFEITGVEFR